MGSAATASTPASMVVGEAMAMAASFLAAVGAAYAAIQIALALYQKFNGCKDEEMDMPQEIKAKKCFYAYKKGCDRTILGICKNKHEDKYCCFDSLLSRLLMEQAITQASAFGKSYSRSAWYKEQQCRGLSLAEVSNVDFSVINLDEWYNLMVQTGALPNGQETLEEWTKDKSFVNPYGRTDALSVQYERDIETQQNYRNEVDKADVLSNVDCSETPNVQGCTAGIFAD